jgi:hypothetical protein
MTKVILGFLSLILIMIFGPLLSIWALNTLFLLEIAYNIKTWLAVLVISAAVGGTKISFKA